MGVIVADKFGRVDSAYHTLVKHINSKYPIVMVSWDDGFVFNDELLGLKDYVLVDFCEYGWDFKITDTHIWGKNTEMFSRYANHAEYLRFDKWVKENPPRLTLKRELLKKDVSETLASIEYPCLVEEQPMQLKQDFDARPINVFQYWGRSNEHRLRIHAEIWNHSYFKGFQVCDNIYYLNGYLQEEKGEKWVSLWIPHYARIDISNLIAINELSKLSLSWEGAGFKCFRTMECPVNSVMVMHRNDFSWTHDWNESNCILVEDFNEINQIEDVLTRKDLYDIYLSGMKTVDKYRLKNYIPYLENLINNA